MVSQLITWLAMVREDTNERKRNLCIGGVCHESIGLGEDKFSGEITYICHGTYSYYVGLATSILAH
jgi:hypothetical protein